MTVNPPTNNKGHAKLVATSATGGTQTYDLVVGGSGTSWPNNYKEASSFTVTVTNVSAGTAPPTLGKVLAILIEDAVDVAGNYITATGGTTPTTGVLAVIDVTAAVAGGTTFTFGNGSATAFTGSNPALSKFGTFRIVLCAGDTLANALRATDTTAGTDTTYHENTDQDNNKKGSLQTATFGSFITGTGGIKAKLTAATRTAGNWKYRQNITESLTFKSCIDGTSNPYNDTGAALKNVKVCWSLDSGVTTPVKKQSITISSAGVVSVPNTPIDTDWGSVVGGSAFFSEVAVGQNFGDATTPSNEKAAIYAIGTTDAADNEQMAYVFQSGAVHVSPWVTSTDANRRLRTNTADQLASAAIQLSKDGLVTGTPGTNGVPTNPGVASFGNSGRTQAQDLFKRTGTVNTTDAIPFLRVFILDAYGSALASITNGFILDTKTQGALSLVTVNTQTLSTDASGKADWSFTIAATSPAFNRFMKAAATRVAGSHVATGPDDATSPPATFNTPNGGIYAGPFPAYPRQVVCTGTGFSTGKEPTANAQSVYGLNSEVIFASMWTGAAANESTDGNGVPNGAGNRNFVIPNSAKCKVTSLINEGNVKVITVGAYNPTTVAGKNIDLAGAEVLQGRRSLWNITTANADDPGTNLSNSLNLDTPLGYATGTSSYDTIGAPTDPSNFAYYQFYKDWANGNEATEDANGFLLTTDSSNVGMQTDQGNFGYKRQALSWVNPDLSLAMKLTPRVVQSDPGLTVRYGIKVFRITPDAYSAPGTGFVDVHPDEAPIYVVYGLNSDGSQTLIGSGSGTPLGTPSTTADYFFDVIVNAAYFAISVFASARVSGSPVAGGSQAFVQVGYVFDAVALATGFSFK